MGSTEPISAQAERSDRPGIGHQIARWISILGHPFVLLLTYVLVASAARLPLGDALALTALVFVVTVLPLLAYIGRLVRSGSSNFDVSMREMRRPVYRLGLGLGVVLVGVFAWIGAPPATFVALGLGIALVAVTSQINRRLKVSLHAAFAAWTAVAFGSLDPLWWLPGGVAVVAIAISRLVLRRHSLPEVAVGLVLGGLFALPMVFVGQA